MGISTYERVMKSVVNEMIYLCLWIHFIFHFLNALPENLKEVLDSFMVKGPTELNLKHQ